MRTIIELDGQVPDIQQVEVEGAQVKIQTFQVNVSFLPANAFKPSRSSATLNHCHVRELMSEDLRSQDGKGRVGRHLELWVSV